MNQMMQKARKGIAAYKKHRSEYIEDGYNIAFNPRRLTIILLNDMMNEPAHLDVTKLSGIHQTGKPVKEAEEAAVVHEETMVARQQVDEAEKQDVTWLVNQPMRRRYRQNPQKATKLPPIQAKSAYWTTRVALAFFKTSKEYLKAILLIENISENSSGW
ncbi:hypothetical protein Cgig2_021415 [Carnegiea gigantea]|uniref:Uncharacterized protein n=1 Tax=Carnegiea gigantea TaxID=171969 RepID=A0A9Q1GMG1_9CARY|nr:hypothetical protein Cgig2_021415 [Carnegiea gigantea]